MRRRDFLATTAAGLALRLRRTTPILAGFGPPAPKARPFPLSQVRLASGPFLDAALVNQRFLLTQDPDRLLHMFRLTAGLPSSAEPLGGWEAPENELRGHYVGHYLSACALLHAGLGSPEAKSRTDLMVAELAKCQHALGNEYLSAFPEEFFDRFRAGQPVWAPWYTVHKIMAGLLDVHALTGNAQALEVLERMARWTRGWVQPLGDAAMARVLEREYGGMNELFYNLSAVTGNSDYQWLAHRFDHERIFAPLSDGRDELKGLHANTTIPKIVGAARRYELIGEARSRRIAEYFWREVTTERAYCTGGTSNCESWNTERGVLATELGGEAQEDCCTYNLLKLTRHVFGWSADPACADYYERALFNRILGSQHPADGSKLYYTEGLTKDSLRAPPTQAAPGPGVHPAAGAGTRVPGALRRPGHVDRTGSRPHPRVPHRRPATERDPGAVLFDGAPHEPRHGSRRASLPPRAGYLPGRHIGGHGRRSDDRWLPRLASRRCCGVGSLQS
jgi:DUF1680 family protein